MTESDSFYQALASLTRGNHLHLDDFSSIVDFLMAICFREQSIELLQAFEEEVRKRGSGVQPSVQKLFAELHSTYSAPGSRERIPQITRRMVELDDLLLRSQREEIDEYERKLSQMLEEFESEEKQRQDEWQDISKELNKQQEELGRLADFLQNDQHQQLSEALDLSEEQPNEVREACVASERQKVAATEMQASLTRRKQLTQCQSQARNVVSQLLNYEDQLHSHMAALKERKEALEELESCGETYTKELRDYDEQLKQVQEKMQRVQNQLQSYKNSLRESTEQLEGGLDEIKKYDGALQQSRLELTCSLDTLEKLRKQERDELLSLDQNFQQQKQLTDTAKELVEFHDDELERKKAELQKCSNELEETVRTLENLKNSLQQSEAELGQLKQAAAPYTQNPSTVERERLQSSIHAQVFKEQENIIEFLSVNVDPEGLATELEIVGLINRDVREEAEVKTITTRKRIRPVMKAVLSKLELSEESADKFKNVLKKLAVLDDLLPIIT